MVSQHVLAIIRLGVGHANIGQALQGEMCRNSIPDPTPEEITSLKPPLGVRILEHLGNYSEYGMDDCLGGCWRKDSSTE